MKSNKLFYSFAVCGLLLSAQGYSLGGGDNGPVMNQVRPNPHMTPTPAQKPAAHPAAPADQGNARRMVGEDGAAPVEPPSDTQDSHGKGSKY